MPRIEGVKALAHQVYDWLINKFELAYVRARKLEASSSSFNFSQSVPLFEEEVEEPATSFLYTPPVAPTDSAVAPRLDRRSAA